MVFWSLPILALIRQLLKCSGILQAIVSLKLASLGVFTPQKLENTTNQGSFFFLKSQFTSTPMTKFKNKWQDISHGINQMIHYMSHMYALHPFNPEIHLLYVVFDQRGSYSYSTVSYP